MVQENKGNFLRYVQLTTTFGITTALRIYILGILAGGWLDIKFGTSLVYVSRVLLAIFIFQVSFGTIVKGK